MPKNKSASVRYRAIDKRLRRKFRPYPTMEELIEAVEEVTDSTISVSSIQKDLNAMRYDTQLGYFAPIKFSKANKGYYYDDPEYSIEGFGLNEDDISSIQMAAAMLNQFRGTEFFKEFESVVDKIIARTQIASNQEMEGKIQLEKAPYYAGSDLINPILEHIRNKDVITFTYQKFNDSKSKQYTIHPYVLKEYRNRWYVTGFEMDSKMIKTFGLERIADMKVETDIKYFEDPDFDPINYYKFALGITTSDSRPLDIVLSFSPQVSDYIRTQPWHESQKELENSKKEYRISLRLVPSMELVMQILSYGKDVKVISPESLKQEVEKRRG
jgi:predicted DNA-binding transcriptional regulator YafY